MYAKKFKENEVYYGSHVTFSGEKNNKVMLILKE